MPLPSSLGPWVDLFQWHELRMWDHLRVACAHNPSCATTLGKTYVGLVRNPTVNASTVWLDEHPLISMNAGSVLNLSRLFKVLMSHPDVLPWIGKASVERVLFPHLGQIDWRGYVSVESILECCDESGAKPLPRDPARSAAADYLMILALDFLFFHELAHLLQGHTRYLIATLGINSIDEVNEIAGLEHKERRTLELLADMGSIDMIAGGLIRTKEDVYRERSWYESRSEALALLAFACGVLFIALGPKKLGVSECHGRMYPHPAVRFWGVQDAMNTITKSMRRDLLDEVRESLRVAARALDATALLFGPETAVTYSLENEPGNVAASFVALFSHACELGQVLVEYGDL